MAGRYVVVVVVIMFEGLVIFVKLQLIIIFDLIHTFKKIFKFLQTGKHEFERICESQCDIYEKTMLFDNWLERTKCKPIRMFLDKHFGKNSKSRTEQTINSITKLTNEIVKIIQKSKRTSLSVKCEANLRDILQRILFYKLSLSFAERMAATKYDQEISSHVEKLISLWNNLVEADGYTCKQTNRQLNAFPEELRKERLHNSNDIVSSRWSHIGFQGSDPGTDFRGMGVLGLTQLEYLSQRPNKLAVDLLRRSLNEKHSYPFAIVGINITYNLLALLKDGSLKHFYYDTGNSLFAKRNKNLVTTLNDLYVELFLRFDCFWHESEPENIFAFRELIDKFISVIRFDLCNRNFGFKFSY